MNFEQQKNLLKTAQPGDLVEYGTLFPNLTKEEIVWKVVEVVEDHEVQKTKVRRIVFHLHVFGVYWKAIVALLYPTGSIKWVGGDL